MSWATKDAAVAELKRNGFKARGADYEVRMYKEGSWQVMPLEDGDPGEATPKQADKAKKEHPADADAKAKIANAESFTINFRASPTKRYDETAATLDEAIAKAQAMNAAHGKHGRRAIIFAIPKGNGAGVPVPYDHSITAAAPIEEQMARKAVVANEADRKLKGANGKAPAEPAPSAPAAPAEQGNDLSPLPAAGGPYAFRIPIGPQFKLPEIAQRIAAKVDMPVEIIDKAGKVVRTIDPRLASPRPPRAARAPSGQSRLSGKSAEVTKLLLRPKGASYAEIHAAYGWRFGDAYLERIARNADAKLIVVGKKHWRLQKDA